MKRIQIDLTNDQLERLKQLMEITEVKSYKDLFDNSLTLFKWAVDEVRAGNEIASVNEDRKRYKVLALPSIERVRPQPAYAD